MDTFTACIDELVQKRDGDASVATTANAPDFCIHLEKLYTSLVLTIMILPNQKAATRLFRKL